MAELSVILSGRAISNETGGNTTYARNLYSGLQKLQVPVRLIPSYQKPILNLLSENLYPLRVSVKNSLIHYTADTGLLFKVRQVPTVTTVHGLASLHVRTGRSASQESVWRYRVSQAIKMSDHIITVSDTSKNDLVSHFGISPEIISVIYHGISSAYFDSSAPTSTWDIP